MYVRYVEEVCEEGGGSLDAGDTYLGPQSFEVALLAMSAWLDAVEHACLLGNKEGGEPGAPLGSLQARAAGCGHASGRPGRRQRLP